MKWIPFLRRYGIFFVVGALIEVSRVLTFVMVLENHSPLIANITSLLFRLVVSFVLHTTITWRDRPGRFGLKLIKFSINQGITSLVKAGLFPFWLVILPCPLYSLVFRVISITGSTIIFKWLSKIVTCELLSAVTMDIVVYLSLGFPLHNWISFAPKRR